MQYRIIRGELYVCGTHDVWYLNHRGFDDPIHWTWENIPLDMFDRIMLDWKKENNA